MPRKTAKEKKKTTRTAKSSPSKKVAKKGKEAQPSRRLHETFGITTLAAAMLLGPSLVSVQFSDGDLMGPLGQVVGSGLNWLIGLTGYLFIGALVVVAIRIFAFGLGLQSADTPAHSLWRERGGMMLGVLCGAVILHLVARPQRINGASAGGFMGEVIAEVICSVVSTPGAWVIALTGLALSVLLATNLSWARAGVWLWATIRSSARALARGTADTAVGGLDMMYELRLASGERLRALYQRFIASTAVHQEVDADGVAALPPVIRLDLGQEESGKERRRTRKKPPVQAKAEPLPVDLEIGQSDEPEPEPEMPVITEAPRGEVEAKGDPTEVDLPQQENEESNDSEKGKKGEDSATATATATATVKAKAKEDDTEKDALTIVESRFDKKLEAAAEEEQEVEQTDSPGFELKGETYKPPPLDLLKFDENAETNVDKEAIYRRADRLVRTLADYKIQGRITEVHPGPVITMYEFVPAPGTRISKVANLANDLAMSLAAQKVRIVAPIPGKRAIGIEVPNDVRETVYFKEIVGNQAFRKGKARLPLALGKNTEGAPVVMDLAKMPHLLVAGATGMGKSVSINAMICSLLMRHTPEEVRLIMVDPKFLELSGYNEIPHLMLPVVTDPKQANVALRWAVNEMERRYQLLADMRVREIASYNKKVDKIRDEALAEGVAMDAEVAEEQEIVEGPNAETLEEAAPAQVMVMRRNADGSEEQVMADVLATEPSEADVALDGVKATPPPPPIRRKRRKDKRDPDKHPRTGEALPRRLPFIVVVIDEFADLMMVASKEVETSVARLAQKARAAGIHVILATQRPSVDVITGLIKANFPSRVSFAVASPHDSKTILGSQGAENLLGNGDMLVMDRGMATKRLHGAYISDEEIQGIVDWLKEQGRPVYDMDILKSAEEDEEGGGIEDEPVDPMYDLAVTFVSDTRRCSISSIQRRLRVGYNRAARMVEMMEHDGVVGPPDRKNNREVLIRSHDGGPA